MASEGTLDCATCVRREAKRGSSAEAATGRVARSRREKRLRWYMRILERTWNHRMSLALEMNVFKNRSRLQKKWRNLIKIGSVKVGAVAENTFGRMRRRRI